MINRNLFFYYYTPYATQATQATRNVFQGKTVFSQNPLLFLNYYLSLQPKKLGMRRFVVIIIMLYVNILVYGQEQIKYCLTNGELIGRKWTTNGDAIVESQYYDSACIAKVFSSEDKKLKRTLRNKALYAMFRDTLYINCCRVVNSDVKIYSAVTKLGNYKMFFAIPPGYYNNSSYAIMGGLLGGLAGGIIAGAVSADKSKKEGWKPCLWDMTKDAITILTPKSVKWLLDDNKKLLRQYKEESKERQHSPSVVLEYLRMLYS